MIVVIIISYIIKMSNLSDMDYLKQDEIGKILAMGLAEVYKQTPKYPIDFFAKWLLNHEN